MYIKPTPDEKFVQFPATRTNILLCYSDNWTTEDKLIVRSSFLLLALQKPIRGKTFVVAVAMFSKSSVKGEDSAKRDMTCKKTFLD